MRYSFIMAEKTFQACSTLYYIYDNYLNEYITTLVIGFDLLNNKYYFTEFRGVNFCDIESPGITSAAQLCAILSDFSIIFSMMDYRDIISGDDYYAAYKHILPKIDLIDLTIYDSEGIIVKYNNEYILEVEDEYLDELVKADYVDGHTFLLEDTSDTYPESFINIDEDPFICEHDEIEGMFLFIKDWEGIKSCAKIYNEGVTI